MNKIEVKDKKSFNVDKDSIFVINNNSNSNYNFNVTCNGKVFIYVTRSCTINFDIDSNLDLNIFSFDTSLVINLNLNKDNILLKYGYSTFNNNDNKYIVNIYHNSTNQEANIINHGLNNTSNRLDFIVNSYVYKESTNVITNQNNKIIIKEDNNSSIKPNLLIDNEEIEASHSAYLGSFKKDDIFYLLTRGLNYDEVIKLLSRSFLMGNLNIGYKEKNIILDKIDMYWR